MGSLFAKALAVGAPGRKLIPLVLGLLITISLIPVVTNPEIMMLFGVYTDHRVVGSSAMVETTSTIGADSNINRSIFPLLYILSETSGLSPESWVKLDSSWLRGILALPWIFLVVPFFVSGCFKLFRVRSDTISQRGVLNKFRQSKIVSTPWSAVLLFIIVSIAISWIVGDTTRWRIPDMPFIAAISSFGWFNTKPSKRYQILLLWITMAGFLFLLYYLLRS
jgi:hypothetical protein